MAMAGKPRTTAQRYADYKRTFPKRVNARRLELIDKMDSLIPPEKTAWRVDEHPGWAEEAERLEREAISDAERAELEECTRVVDAWEEASPWNQDLVRYQKEQDDRLAAVAKRQGWTWPPE
jgi:hypothetical protein